jgi:hypothetical protein
MSRRYSLDELQNFVGVIELASAHPGLAQDGEREERSEAGDRKADANFKAIEAGCQWVREQVAQPAGQPYPAWLAMAAITSRCKEGLTAFDAMSRQDSRYSPHETREKLDEAFATMRPPTCRYIQETLHSNACKGCAVRHVVRSPMAFGRQTPEVAALQGEYVFDVTTRRFASVRSRAGYTNEAFSARFAHHHPEQGNISNALIRDKWSGRVERFVYRPGVGSRLIEEPIGWVFNEWQDTGVKPEDGDCSVILEHLEKLIPNEAERNHMLDYLAFHLQNPGVKITHGLIIQGRQGTGKSYLRHLLAEMIGAENCGRLEPDMLDQPWTAGWSNKQALVIEEMMSGERLETYNRLKTWMSEEEVMVNQKHVPQYLAATPRIMLVLTNHKVATVVPPDDRRFFVIASDMEPQTPEYYKRLWNEGVSQAPSFKGFLLRRDVSGFKPGAPPPMTAAKAEMIEDSAPPLQRTLEELIAEGAYPFHRALVRQDAVRNALHARLNERPRENALIGAMRAVGMRKREGQVLLADGTKPRFWIIRDHDFWANCSPEDIRREAAKPFQNGSGS